MAASAPRGSNQLNRPGRLLGVSLFTICMYLLQLGCSIAILAIVRDDLNDVVWVQYRGYTYIRYECLMSTPDNWQGACPYAYSLAAVSIFWVVMLMLLMVLTYDLWDMGRLVEALLDLCAALWWLAGAIVMTVYGVQANKADMPGRGWRNAIIGLSWASFFIFCVLLAMNIHLIATYGPSNAQLDSNKAREWRERDKEHGSVPLAMQHDRDAEAQPPPAGPYAA